MDKAMAVAEHNTVGWTDALLATDRVGSVACLVYRTSQARYM